MHAMAIGFGAVQQRRSTTCIVCAFQSPAQSTVLNFLKLMPANAANAESLIRELGSTQHLERERSRLKLRAFLRETGVAYSR